MLDTVLAARLTQPTPVELGLQQSGTGAAFLLATGVRHRWTLAASRTEVVQPESRVDSHPLMQLKCIRPTLGLRIRGSRITPPESRVRLLRHERGEERIRLHLFLFADLNQSF